jgi:hypothetical protein
MASSRRDVKSPVFSLRQDNFPNFQNNFRVQNVLPERCNCVVKYTNIHHCQEFLSQFAEAVRGGIQFHYDVSSVARFILRDLKENCRLAGALSSRNDGAIGSACSLIFGCRNEVARELVGLVLG